jgi:hypothetical protein
MKSLYQYVSGILLTGILSTAVITTASAQRGGGGGSHVSGGGGGFGGSFRGSSNTSGFGGASRSSFSNARNNVSSGKAVATRGTIGYARGGYYRPGYGYYGYPHLGFYLGFLPFGYYPFYWDDALYYYNDGIFYQPYDGGGYEVTTPPVGAAVPGLPQGAKSIMIDNQQFYELNGVYYKAVVNDQGKTVYVVAGKDGVLNTDGSDVSGGDSAAPQVGDIVNELPDGCRKVILNGKRYFVSPNDIYYQPYTDKSGNSGYRIASVPSNEQEN